MTQGERQLYHASLPVVKFKMRLYSTFGWLHILWNNSYSFNRKCMLSTFVWKQEMYAFVPVCVCVIAFVPEYINVYNRYIIYTYILIVYDDSK